MNRITSLCLLAACGLLVAACSDKSPTPTAGSAGVDWPTTWCQAQPGMSRDQIIGLMGQPTSTDPGHLIWASGHQRFSAALEKDGTARQLDFSLADLTVAEKAAMGCPDARGRNSVTARAEKSRPAYRPACELVTQADMSAILGAAVVAKPGHGSATQSECIYEAASGNLPYAELEVDRGDGEAGMQGAGFAGGAQSGLTNPYAGIGDQAVGVGPALFVRTGDDLVKIVVSGAKDRKTAVRKIFDTAKAGM